LECQRTQRYGIVRYSMCSISNHVKLIQIYNNYSQSSKSLGITGRWSTWHSSGDKIEQSNNNHHNSHSTPKIKVQNTKSRNVVVLLYGLSTAFIAVDAGISLVLTTLLLIGQPIDVHQIVASVSPFIPNNVVPVQHALVVASILSFIVTWIATVFMLRHHSRRIGAIKYWVIVSIPLVYFLTQFQPLFLYLFSYYGLTGSVSFSITYTIIFSSSKPAGGLLFAAAFWSIARTIGNRQLRGYMIISAYGLALIFASEQAIIITNKPYPPFGLATISFLGLSSYLTLSGIYYSAVSVSQDSKLRQSIRNFAIKESRLLDSIGTAQMEQEIENRVIDLTKRSQNIMAEESGIESSLSEDDVKQYLAQVIAEVQKDVNDNKNSN
jgi:hypothetical protein